LRRQAEDALLGTALSGRTLAELLVLGEEFFEECATRVRWAEEKEGGRLCELHKPTPE
jgi:hypothetical protein